MPDRTGGIGLNHARRILLYSVSFQLPASSFPLHRASACPLTKDEGSSYAERSQRGAGSWAVSVIAFPSSGGGEIRHQRWSFGSDATRLLWPGLRKHSQARVLSVACTAG